jgi:hypothetical protein
MDDQRVRGEAAAGRDALLAADPVNRLITIDSIQTAHLTKHLLGSRLTLTYRDHVSDKFEWKRTYNGHAAVVALLTGVLGAKLRAG